MALQTGHTFVDISIYFAMVIIGLVFTMALETRELPIVIGIGVAVGAIVPGLTVGATINWKKLPIMVKLGRLPTWIGGMASRTIRWEIRRKVIWICGLVVIVLVTAHTIW